MLTLTSAATFCIASASVPVHVTPPRSSRRSPTYRRAHQANKHDASIEWRKHDGLSVIQIDNYDCASNLPGCQLSVRGMHLRPHQPQQMALMLLLPLLHGYSLQPCLARCSSAAFDLAENQSCSLLASPCCAGLEGVGQSGLSEPCGRWRALQQNNIIFTTNVDVGAAVDLGCTAQYLVPAMRFLSVLMEWMSMSARG